MVYQYRRRKPSILRNLWVYRRLFGSAILLGLMLWFIWANDTAVTVAFPFRLGSLNSKLGVVILLSALVGSLLTFLVMTFVLTVRRIRGPQSPTAQNVRSNSDLDDDRPPPDYAAKTTDGFSNPEWSSRVETQAGTQSATGNPVYRNLAPPK
jgi:uncharacterized integral membrane protein